MIDLEMAGAELVNQTEVSPTPTAELRRRADKRRSRRRVARAGAVMLTAVAVVAVFVVSRTSDTSEHVMVSSPPRPGLAREHDCPGMIGDTLAGATVADLERRGAADGLPEDGATTLGRVTAAVRLSRADLTRRYRGVLRITVGKGLGWTFSENPPASVTYHRVDDYQVVVHLGRKQDCPAFNAFVANDRGQRVPVLFLHPDGG
jgi:hypothetical protein